MVYRILFVSRRPIWSHGLLGPSTKSVNLENVGLSHGHRCQRSNNKATICWTWQAENDKAASKRGMSLLGKYLNIGYVYATWGPSYPNLKSLSRWWWDRFRDRSRWLSTAIKFSVGKRQGLDNDYITRVAGIWQLIIHLLVNFLILWKFVIFFVYWIWTECYPRILMS